MYDSFTKAHETYLLVDDGAGVILEAPGFATISRRNVEANRYIFSVIVGDEEQIFAGPDAKAAALGHISKDNYVKYIVIRDAAGFLEMTRVV